MYGKEALEAHKVEYGICVFDRVEIKLSVEYTVYIILTEVGQLEGNLSCVCKCGPTYEELKYETTTPGK